MSIFTDAFWVSCDGILVTLYGYYLSRILSLSFFCSYSDSPSQALLSIALSLQLLSTTLTRFVYPALSLAFASFPLLSLCRGKGLGGSLGQRTFQAETYRPPLSG